MVRACGITKSFSNQKHELNPEQSQSSACTCVYDIIILYLLRRKSLKRALRLRTAYLYFNNRRRVARARHPSSARFLYFVPRASITWCIQVYIQRITCVYGLQEEKSSIFYNMCICAAKFADATRGGGEQ